MKSLLIGLGLSCFLLGDLGAAPRPNVVVFLADDAGWGDYGHSGNTQAARRTSTRSPGAACRSIGSSSARCAAPTRAEFLTGRYHPRGGVRGVSTGQERLDLDEKTIADAFQAAGYATGAFGKWHNGSQWPYHPVARGFDEYFGHTAGHWGEYFDAPLEDSQGRLVRTQGYIVDVCTDRALAFIEQNKDRPFFCYVPVHHAAFAVGRARRVLAAIPGQADHAAGHRAGTGSTSTRPAARWPCWRTRTGTSAACWPSCGELGLEDNTIVLYFSDNGPNSWRWNGGMKGRKGSTDEGGVRSVCYLRWPARLPAGHTVTQISGAIDLLPTLTALAGIPRVGDKPLDGRDLSPLLSRQDGGLARSHDLLHLEPERQRAHADPPPGQRGPAVRHARRSRPDDAGQRPGTRAGGHSWPRPSRPGVRRCSAQPAAERRRRSPKARRNAPRAATPWTRARFPSATANSPSPCSRRATASRAAA